MTTVEPLDTQQAAQMICALLGRIDHAGREAYTPDEWVAVLTRVREVARRVEALDRILIAECDSVGATLRSAGTPTSSWLVLTDQTLVRGEAQGKIYSGRDLLAGSAIRDAALAGELSPRQARLVGQAMDQLPHTLSEEQVLAAERDFVEHAPELEVTQLGRAVRETLERIAPEHLPSDESEQKRLAAQTRRARARRHLRFVPDGDGGVHVRGNLPALDIAPLRAAIDAIVESERRQSRGVTQVDEVQLTPDQRRADALVTLTTRGWGSGGQQIPRVAAERPRVVVLMNEADLRKRAEPVGALVDGTEVSAGDLRRLCCDADLLPVVLGSQSEPLDVGLTSRLVTPSIRRALTLRDKGCVFPGCDAPDARCEAHHIIPWYAGGETSMNNLCLVCSHHHRLVEPSRFWATAESDRWGVKMIRGRPVVIPPRRFSVPQKSA
ncbi:HNH endonuclease [Enemella dayhoffiae]|uniref:HNH endonuclease n=1 Tax=Enemella dayhoffiae TaxID=2016507 RepID=A0A255H0J2_9ACTN|nr:HNH endonuclease signature motif containing protein [Enemella dayhoffiae]OYO21258.1 HNH endonuclease [Enemella dayhoffiae]